MFWFSCEQKLPIMIDEDCALSFYDILNSYRLYNLQVQVQVLAVGIHERAAV